MTLDLVKYRADVTYRLLDHVRQRKAFTSELFSQWTQSDKTIPMDTFRRINSDGYIETSKHRLVNNSIGNTAEIPLEYRKQFSTLNAAGMAPNQFGFALFLQNALFCELSS